MTGSAGQRRVPENFLAKLEVPLPPLAEQRRIAEVLDRAESLRAKRRSTITQLDYLTQSLFLDLFGNPAGNPRNWPVKTLDDLCRGITDIVTTTCRSQFKRVCRLSPPRTLSDDGRIAFENVKRIF